MTKTVLNVKRSIQTTKISAYPSIPMLIGYRVDSYTRMCTELYRVIGYKAFNGL